MRIEQVLKTLAVESPPPLTRLESRWVRTIHHYDPARRRRLIDHLNQRRRAEQIQMDAYRAHTGCLMEFLAKALDDPTAKPCGQCAPCQGKLGAMREVAELHVRDALAFLCRLDVPIEPRKRWQPGAFSDPDWKGKIVDDLSSETGRALCLLGDPGWGSLVRRGKYGSGQFEQALIDALATLVQRLRPRPSPTWVTCVPSLTRPTLVAELGAGLASRLSLPFVGAVVKVRATLPQKEMENSWQQAHNLDRAFEVKAWHGLSGSVLLVDDIVDSRWTMTVVGALLRQAGSGPVFPIALAMNR
jgi:ATP-dependent DNA helicase RecQ